MLLIDTVLKCVQSVIIFAVVLHKAKQKQKYI